MNRLIRITLQHLRPLLLEDGETQGNHRGPVLYILFLITFPDLKLHTGLVIVVIIEWVGGGENFLFRHIICACLTSYLHCDAKR